MVMVLNYKLKKGQNQFYNILLMAILLKNGLQYHPYKKNYYSLYLEYHFVVTRKVKKHTVIFGNLLHNYL